jgi:hypothetical protein
VIVSPLEAPTLAGHDSPTLDVALQLPVHVVVRSVACTRFLLRRCEARSRVVKFDAYVFE